MEVNSIDMSEMHHSSMEDHCMKDVTDAEDACGMEDMSMEFCNTCPACATCVSVVSSINTTSNSNDFTSNISFYNSSKGKPIGYSSNLLRPPISIT
jgi:hypothetical protein